mmetsp:Transcript_1721/g.2390  ORF Transcript_1721/g.2390 Transcript_1721/m.2390 type:complete len:114 (+) Transcript_1721:212-553(+)
MKKLEKLLKSGDASKLIYVPGGTDSASLYDHDYKEESKKAINLHKGTYQLAEGLLMAGLGGSVPAVFHSSESSDDAWGGEILGSYPYEDDLQMQDDLDEFWYDKVIPEIENES